MELEKLKIYPIADLCRNFGVKILQSNFIKSPYREEKTASTKLYLEDNSFYDFATARGGDVITLFAAFRGITDPKIAVREFDRFVSSDWVETIQMRELKLRLEKDEIKRDSLSLLEQEFYEERLGMGMPEAQARRELQILRIKSNLVIFNEFLDYCSSRPHKEAMEYLINGRGLSKEVLKKFRIVTIANYFEVSNHLKKKFNINDLVRSGLFNLKGNLVFYSHRIVIPYFNGDGDCVYMRGRFFDPEKECDGMKYIGLRNDVIGVNTPKRFFNYQRLRSLEPGADLYITEGEFDTLALEDLGLPAIGIPGVGCTPRFSHIKALSKYNVFLLPDNDPAGEGLEIHLGELMKTAGVNFLVKRLPDNVKDVSEFAYGS